MSELTAIKCRVCDGCIGIVTGGGAECFEFMRNAMAEILPGLEVLQCTREQAQQFRRCFCLVPGAWNV